MLNQSRLSTTEKIAQEIEDYFDATEEFSHDDKNKLDSFLQSVKALRKVENDGVPYNCGNSSGKKGKRKMHKWLGFQPERFEQRKFGGYCNWCCRVGHKEALVLD